MFKKEKLNQIKKQRGMVALESIIAGGAMLFLFILIIGYFTFLYPRYMVDLEVQSLASAIKMDGKLTQSDMDAFVLNMIERGYKESEVRSGVKVIAQNVTPGKEGLASNGDSLIDLDSYTAPVVERNNGQILVTVTVPSNSGVLKTGAKWFGFGSEVDNTSFNQYTVKRVVMSEFYLPKNN